jgi:flotillin
MSVIAIAVAALVLVLGVSETLRWSFKTAQPDEWLLCIRNGKLRRAGIGIHLWRVPGDVVVRFTSTTQRVSFSADALSDDRLRVTVEGFILWSVSAAEDRPFVAFQRMGLVNLDAPPFGLKSNKHLLSTPQHHAFQQMLAAAVQRLAARYRIDDLMLRQDVLVGLLRSELGTLEKQLGIQIDDVQMLRIRPTDDKMMGEMSTSVEERLRKEAAASRIDAAERTKRRVQESEARLSQEKTLRQLAEIERNREVKAREQAIARELALGEAASQTQVAHATLEREEMQLVARLDRMRRLAQAKAAAVSSVAGAEEQMSQPVRDFELSKVMAEKVGDALRQMPIHDARWVTVGPDSPLSSLAGLIAGARELVTGEPKKAAP